jgi:hypothetical protein
VKVNPATKGGEIQKYDCVCQKTNCTADLYRQMDPNDEKLFPFYLMFVSVLACDWSGAFQIEPTDAAIQGQYEWLEKAIRLAKKQCQDNYGIRASRYGNQSLQGI